MPPDTSGQLADLLWDDETLRILMNHMLRRNNIGPFDLLKEWDKTLGDYMLNHNEFVESIRSLFNEDDELLWQHEVLPAVLRAFHAILSLWKGASGLHLTSHVDQERFERWLNVPAKRPLLTKVQAEGKEPCTSRTGTPGSGRRPRSMQRSPRAASPLNRETLEVMAKAAAARVSANEAIANLSGLRAPLKPSSKEIGKEWDSPWLTSPSPRRRRPLTARKCPRASSAAYPRINCPFGKSRPFTAFRDDQSTTTQAMMAVQLALLNHRHLQIDARARSMRSVFPQRRKN